MRHTRHIAALHMLVLSLFFVGAAVAESSSAVHGEKVVYEHDGVELTG